MPSDPLSLGGAADGRLCWEVGEAVGQRWPDCDPIIHEWVMHVVRGLEHTVGPNLIGTYLHGSLASGGFYPPKSDVDLLFVTERTLPVAVRRTFAQTCVELSRDRPIVGGLECSVILGTHAATATYPMPFEVHFSEELVGAVLADEVDWGKARTDSDLAAHCQAVLEIGVVLHGPPIASTFGPVKYVDFIESVTNDLDWILTGTNIVGSPVYGVLNSCRMLWLWKSRSPRLVPGKEEAAAWCAPHVPLSLRGVVLQALAVYQSTAPVNPEARKTGGDQWDTTQLLAFRDYVRQQRSAASAF